MTAKFRREHWHTHTLALVKFNRLSVESLGIYCCCGNGAVVVVEVHCGDGEPICAGLSERERGEVRWGDREADYTRTAAIHVPINSTANQSKEVNICEHKKGGKHRRDKIKMSTQRK